VAGVNKETAIRAVIDATTDEPVIFTTGYSCRIARHLGDRPSHFYMTGSMGLASSIGVGVALATGHTAVIVDGDGSLLMNPVGLMAVGAHANLRLVHIVLDDGRYASTGGQPVPSQHVDVCALARASGYSRVFELAHADEFEGLVRAEVARCFTPVFIRCAVSDEATKVPGRIDGDLAEHAGRFGAHLAMLMARARAAAG
jgi:sulfopyruvate decarboxylase subunit beta